MNALGDDGAAGHRARRRLEKERRLHAPELVDLEVLASLRRLVASGRIEPPRAEQALIALHRLRLRRYPHEPLLVRAWELRENLTPYDAAYVALAERLRFGLLTADSRLSRAHGPSCPVEILGG